MSSSTDLISRRLSEPLAGASFSVMSRAIGQLRWLGIDIIHTARTFKAYRQMFFRGQDETALLRSLAGKRVVDVACGYTPYAPDSMFHACEAAGVEFYGVDPVLTQPLVPSLKNRTISRWTGGSGQFLRSPPGIERALGVYAQAMPFDDDSVDHILCAYLLWVWLEDEDALAEGRRLRQAALNLISQCHTDAFWYGYSEKIETLSLPNWAYNSN